MNTSSSERIRQVEMLSWVAIYGGLISLVLGLFLLRDDSPVVGHVFTWGGAAATIAGVLLVWWRSRMTEPPGPGHSS